MFENPEAVEEVMKNIPHTIDKRTVDAKRAIPHAIHQVCRDTCRHLHTTSQLYMSWETVLKAALLLIIRAFNLLSFLVIMYCVLQALKNRTKKIFVGGVPVDMPEETIREYFVQFGEVRRAQVGGKITLCIVPNFCVYTTYVQ